MDYDKIRTAYGVAPEAYVDSKNQAEYQINFESSVLIFQNI
jgi:hypothetical protein